MIFPPIDTHYLLDTLRQMVRINSVLPHEERLADFIAEKLRELEIEPEWHLVASGRPNVYASAQIGSNPRFLTLSGHLDTVDVAQGWETDPFEPVERNGRLYGLGAADMKAGLACALAAFKALLESRDERYGKLGFAATVDEEGLGIGARALCQTAYARSDAILLAEPHFGKLAADTVPIGMTGKVLYKLIVRGRAAHAFHPERGVNAVEDAARIVAALERLAIGSHPVMGTGNFSTLKINGGYREYAVVVPEQCEVVITRLLVAGESSTSAIAEMQNLVESLKLRSHVTIESMPPYYEPYFLNANTAILNMFKKSYREVVGQEPHCGPRQGITDANIYVAEYGIPTVVFGPQGGCLHGAGEYVEVDTLLPVAEIYVRTACKFWGIDVL